MPYFYMEKGWHDSPCFKDNDDRFAWVWLIGNAAHTDTVVGVRGNPIHLKRGQLSFSVRFLAVAWRVSTKKARIIMERFKKWQMIGTEKGKVQDIITICNYDKYQDKRNKKGTARAHGRADEGQTKGHKEEGSLKEVKEVKEVYPLPPTGGGEDEKSFHVEARLTEYVKTWNDETGGVFSKATQLSAARRKHLSARIKQGMTLDEYRALCRDLKGWGWATGKNERGWKADFDYSLKEKTLTMFREGRLSANKEAQSGVFGFM